MTITKKLILVGVIALPAFCAGYFSGTGSLNRWLLKSDTAVSAAVLQHSQANPSEYVFARSNNARVETLLQASAVKPERADREALVDFEAHNEQVMNALRENVEMAPDSVIKQYLTGLFGDDILDSVADPKTFASHLLEIASQPVAEPVEQADEATENTEYQLTFSQSPILGLRPLEGGGSIMQYASVFSHVLPREKVAPRDVFVKWYDHSSGNMVMLGKERLIMQPDGSATFSAYPRQGWNKGYYTVNIYAVSDNLTLLGSGHYFISQVELQAEGRSANQDIINDLVAAGRAQTKIR